MRPSPLLSSLTLGLLLLVPPVYAVNYTGEAILDWNTLKFSGIPITMMEDRRSQGYSSFIDQNHTLNSGFNDWRPYITTLNGPQGTTAITAADSSRLYAFFGTSGSMSGNSEVDRLGNFTALGTGQLTVSIDYTLRTIDVASLPNGFTLGTGGLLTLEAEHDHNSQMLESHAQLFGLSGLTDQQQGTLSLTEPYQRGETGEFVASAFVATSGAGGSLPGFGGSSVPVPDMLWPTLAGMIGIAVWAERRRRQTRFTK